MPGFVRRLSHWIPLAVIALSCALSYGAPVAPGFELIPGATPADAQPDGNSVIIAAPDGLIVFDTPRTYSKDH